MPATVSERPRPVPLTTRALRWAAWATGALCLLVSLVVIERVPIPWLDEVYLVSVANSVAHGPDQVQPLTPRPEWVDGYEKIYGPVFFHAEAAFIRQFGLSPLTGRIVGWLGGVLAAFAVAGLVLVVGGSIEWAGIAFALFTLTPELSIILRNGRMDSLALGFEFAGMGFLLAAMRWPALAIPWSLTAGVFWALALLTTPRILPFLAGLIVASPVLVTARETRKTFILSITCLFAVVLFGLYLWADHTETTIIGWAVWLFDCLKDDAYNVVLPGHQRYWAMGMVTALTPIAVVLASGCIGALVLLRERTYVGGITKQRLIFWYLFMTAVFNAVFYLVVANYAFGISQYFILPLFVVVVMASAVTVKAGARAWRLMLAFWLAAGVFFAAAHVVKYVEVWQTWELRDPKIMRDFIARFVPRGSIVYGYDQYYFYAVEDAGSTFRTYNVRNAGMEHLKGPVSVRQNVLPAADQSFLLWPADDPNATFPSWFECARSQVVARFDAKESPIGIEQFLPFVMTSYAHGYPATVLYQVPPGCPIASP